MASIIDIATGLQIDFEVLSNLKKHSLRHMAMVSDGDSKSCDQVCQARVYGHNKLVEKEDWINHVSKRMGTALRKLADVIKAQEKESL